MALKLTVIGGGALRVLYSIRNWADEGEVARGSHITLMDQDPRRVNLIAGLARKMPQVIDAGFTIEAATELGPALEGADFVYNVIRVGGVEALETDVRIGVKYNFHGADDFGPSGAMLTLRTVPVVVNIAREMEQRCPHAWLLNYTNPTGFVTRAVLENTSIKMLGFCGGDIMLRYDIPGILGWDTPQPDMDFTWRGVGMDHFSWMTELKYHGEDFYPRLYAELAQRDREAMPWRWKMYVDTLQLYRLWMGAPSHCHHWTHHDYLLEDTRQFFADCDKGLHPDRNARQNKEIDDAEALLGEDLGAGYWEYPLIASTIYPFPSPALKAASSMLRDAGDEIMVNMGAPGCAGNLPADGVLYLTAKFLKDGPQPLHFEGVPPAMEPLTAALLAFQGALVEVAMRGTRLDLERAIMMDPMMRDLTKVRAMYDELLAANQPYLREELLSY